MTLFADYIYGLAGLSLLRRWYTDEASTHRDRLVALAAEFETNDMLQFNFATPEHEAQAGYTLWAESYDGENPMITAEEQLVQPRLQELFEPGKLALDAGCGTGRHAATMVALGYDVIGTDLTPAMLDIARAQSAHSRLPTGAVRGSSGRRQQHRPDRDRVGCVPCDRSHLRVRRVCPRAPARRQAPAL